MANTLEITRDEADELLNFIYACENEYGEVRVGNPSYDIKMRIEEFLDVRD